MTSILFTLLKTILSLMLIFPASAGAASAGNVHFMQVADSSFDRYTASPSPGTHAWLRSHMWRMLVWSPYFDDKASWYPNGWVYDDAYAIYRGEQLSRMHPEWILRDANGTPLYIPYECGGGTCPQYAADISDKAYRQYWISTLKRELARGYKGVFVDDVNMDMQVSDGYGQNVAPLDPSTGRPMTGEAWRRYMAQFMTEIRAALPSQVEIVHNVIWFADNHAGTSDTNISEEISAANYISLERGINDSGLTGGNGPWSVNSLLSYIDEIHRLGKGVILGGDASDPASLQYNLAAYFLISTGRDAVSGGGQAPAHWWRGYDVRLGAPTGLRRHWRGLWRRDYTRGVIVLNPPDSPTVTVRLRVPMVNLDGRAVTSVTLHGATGAVLLSRRSQAVVGLKQRLSG